MSLEKKMVFIIKNVSKIMIVNVEVIVIITSVYAILDILCKEKIELFHFYLKWVNLIKKGSEINVKNVIMVGENMMKIVLKFMKTRIGRMQNENVTNWKESF
jgi:hypothetical protein